MDLENRDIEVNKVLSRILRVISYIVFIIVILSLIDITPFNKLNEDGYAFLPAIVFFLLPTIFVDFLHNEKQYIKYVILFTSIIGFSIIVTFLKYPVMIILIAPALMLNLYLDKKLNYVSFITVLIAAVVCSIIRLQLKYDGFDDLKILIKNEVLSFISAYIAVTIYVILAMRYSSRLYELANDKSKQINDENRSLDQTISNSIEIFSSKNLNEFYETCEKALKDAIRPFVNPQYNQGIYFGHLSNKSFSVIKSGKLYSTLMPINGELTLGTTNQMLTIKTERLDRTNSFEINNNSIIIKFYNEKGLIRFIIVDCQITAEDLGTLRDIIQILTNNMGIAIKNLKLTLDLLDTQSEMIYAFSSITDSKSHQTGNHIRRVREYMTVLAKEAGFSADYSEKIGIASMMHDIGKIFIPSEILEKKHSLTDEEYKIIKTHVTQGVDLIKNCPGDVMNLAKIMIKEHHERWDGNGYLGLKGNEIHTIGRLIAVADVFDALISKRSYKDGLPPNEVYKIIVSESGKQFDPRIVEIFKKKFKELVKIHDDYKDE